MKQKATVTLDELDVKCLNELPVILDVLSSTANKLTRIYNPLFDDLLVTLNSNKPASWELRKDCTRGIFYPFTNEYGKDNIDTLYAFLSVYYEALLVPQASPGSDSISLMMGLYYDADDEEMKRPCHYFQIWRKIRKKGFPLNERIFYQGIQERIADEKIHVRIYHPESGDKKEDITLLVYEHNTEVITEAFELFKAEVLLPFLESLNSLSNQEK